MAECTLEQPQTGDVSDSLSEESQDGLRTATMITCDPSVFSECMTFGEQDLRFL